MSKAFSRHLASNVGVAQLSTLPNGYSEWWRHLEMRLIRKSVSQPSDYGRIGVFVTALYFPEIIPPPRRWRRTAGLTGSLGARHRR